MFYKSRRGVFGNTPAETKASRKWALAIFRQNG
jgi:hypothetical protein